MSQRAHPRVVAEIGCNHKGEMAIARDLIESAARFAKADFIKVIERNPHNATDTASSEAVMLELSAQIKCDVLSLIQATSPLTRAEDFRAARASRLSNWIPR